MISVEFRAVKAGVCQWCKKERDEVYDVSFSDRSFVGCMCKGDLLRAIGMKLEAGETRPTPPPVAAAVSVGNGPAK